MTLIGRDALLFGIACVCLGSIACSEEGPKARPAFTREQLLDPKNCKDCHPKHYAEWSASMHAYATKDPVFLAMNKRGQEETQGNLGPFCIQCHAPMAVQELKQIGDFTALDKIPEHLQGVTCYFCHNAVSFGADHTNANIQLANDTTMRAAIDSALVPSVHKVAYSVNHDPNKLSSSLMCGTCHDIKTPTGFHLEQTLAEYQTTFMSKETPPGLFQSCQDCHMERDSKRQLAAQSSGIPGVSTSVRTVHEHLFAAVDLPLTDFPGAAAMRLAVEKCELPESISYFNVSLSNPLGAFEVKLETQAGHAQPSGATQDRRMWVEVDGYDEAGQLVFSEGAIPDGRIEEPADAPPHPCMLRDYVVDAAGKETHDFWEVAKRVKSRLIPPPTTPTAGSHTLDCAFGARLVQPAARLEFRLRMRPIGLDVLQDLVSTGHLAPEFVTKMPTLTFLTQSFTFDRSAFRYVAGPSSEQDCDTYKHMLEEDANAALAGAAAKLGANAGSPP